MVCSYSSTQHTQFNLDFDFVGDFLYFHFCRERSKTLIWDVQSCQVTKNCRYKITTNYYRHVLAWQKKPRLSHPYRITNYNVQKNFYSGYISLPYRYYGGGSRRELQGAIDPPSFQAEPCMQTEHYRTLRNLPEV